MKLILKLIVLTTLFIPTSPIFAEKPIYLKQKMLSILNYCDTPITFKVSYKGEANSSFWGSHTLPQGKDIEIAISDFIIDDSRKIVMIMTDGSKNTLELPVITNKNLKEKDRFLYSTQTLQVKNGPCVFDKNEVYINYADFHDYGNP